MAEKTLVVYRTGYRTGNEVLVCAKEDEPRLLKEYFEQGGRDLDEYDRYETDKVKDNYAVVVNSGSLTVNLRCE